jgi:hypothetical protein
VTIIPHAFELHALHASHVTQFYARQHLTKGATFEFAHDDAHCNHRQFNFSIEFEPYTQDGNALRSMQQMRNAVSEHKLCRLLDRRALHGRFCLSECRVFCKNEKRRVCCRRFCGCCWSFYRVFEEELLEHKELARADMEEVLKEVVSLSDKHFKASQIVITARGQHSAVANENI